MKEGIEFDYERDVFVFLPSNKGIQKATIEQTLNRVFGPNDHIDPWISARNWEAFSDGFVTDMLGGFSRKDNLPR